MEAYSGGEEKYFCTEDTALVPSDGRDLVRGEVGNDVAMEVFEV